MYEGPVQDLIDELGRLPGIGPKSAQRLAFHILAADSEEVMRLADTLKLVKNTVKFCEVCFNVAEETRCRICRDPRRDQTAICVVEESKDVVAVERTREFRGRYHVLGGAISPIDGIGPADLKIRELCLRLADGVGHRGHPRDRPEPGRRGDRDLSEPAAAAAGRSGQPPGQRAPRRR